MTCFCELSHYAQMALIIITWLGVLAQLALPLYRFSYRRAVVHTVLDGVILFVLLALLCFLVRYNQHVTQSDFHLPVPALICILVAAFAYSVISLIAECGAANGKSTNGRSKKRLTIFRWDFCLRTQTDISF